MKGPNDDALGAPNDEEIQPRPSPALVMLGLAFLVLGIIAGLVMSAGTFR